MRILVLYGPNLNLLGLVSRAAGGRLTLDKLNRALRRQAAGLSVELHIAQLQDEAAASKLVQRQRQKVAGVLLIPGIWARTGLLLHETLTLVGLPVAVFQLTPEPGPWALDEEAVFRDVAVLSAAGPDGEQLAGALKALVSHLSS